jgi:hypothetical protein
MGQEVVEQGQKVSGAFSHVKCPAPATTSSRRVTGGDIAAGWTSGTSVTELVYRYQSRPVIQTGATIMDALFRGTREGA